MTGEEYIKIGKESDFLPELMHDSDEGRFAKAWLRYCLLEALLAICVHDFIGECLSESAKTASRGEIFYMDFPYFQPDAINLHI